MWRVKKAPALDFISRFPCPDNLRYVQFQLNSNFEAAMKILSVVCLVAFVSASVNAQVQQDKMFYMAKAEKFRAMKNTGMTLTMVGCIAIVGAVLTSSTNSGAGPQTSTNGNPDINKACILISAAGLGMGIPLWAVGANREKKYRRRVASFSASINPQVHGLTLRVKF